MKFYIIISFIVLPIISFGQYFGLNITDSVIAANKVYKHVEYDNEDSTLFFKEHPNAYYGIYNKKGQLIERNNYTMGHNHSLSEFLTYYFYDDKGQNILWLWYDTTYPEKVSRIRIEEYDSSGNNYGYKDFSRGHYSSDTYETKEYCRTKKHESKEIIDSIISETKREFYHFCSENKLDTLEHRIEYYTNQRLDSIFVFFKRKNYPLLYTEKYNYYDTSNVFKQLEIQSIYKYDSKRDLYRTNFSNNGLPAEKWYIYINEGKVRETHTSFIYEFYKD